MTESTAKHRVEAREMVRLWADSMSTVSWYDGHELIVYNLPHELDANNLIERVAQSLSSRDTEICEVLEELVVSVIDGKNCWCADPFTADSEKHDSACLAARELWNKVQTS